jgi:hypothetical protein
MPIRANLKPGSVYYFADPCLDPATDSHYFIVLNSNPHSDSVLYLVCASSQVEKVRRMRHIHPGTTVEIDPNTYNDFRVLSIVDCNVVFEKSINELVQKYARGQLRFKTDMPMDVVERLRSAVVESVVVEDYIRDMFI